MLVVMIASLLLPYSAHIAVSQNGGERLFTLDVCQGAGPLASTHADIPCLYECTGAPVPLTFAGFVEVSNAGSTLSSFFSTIKQPPRA